MAGRQAWAGCEERGARERGSVAGARGPGHAAVDGRVHKEGRAHLVLQRTRAREGDGGRATEGAGGRACVQECCGRAGEGAKDEEGVKGWLASAPEARFASLRGPSGLRCTAGSGRRAGSAGERGLEAGGGRTTGRAGGRQNGRESRAAAEDWRCRQVAVAGGRRRLGEAKNESVYEEGLKKAAKGDALAGIVPCHPGKEGPPG